VSVTQDWLEQNCYSDRWINAKYKCVKETKGCNIYPTRPRIAGRCKCIPCKFLKVVFEDGVIVFGGKRR